MLGSELQHSVPMLSSHSSRHTHSKEEGDEEEGQEKEQSTTLMRFTYETKN